MNAQFAYIVTSKDTGVPLQNVQFSREDARDKKRQLEQRDGEKYQVVRYVAEKIVR